VEIARVAGRLIVFRFPQKVVMADLGPFVADVRKLLGAVHAEGKRAVTCGDVRRTTILTPDVVDGLVNLLKADNPVIEKTGVVVGNATFGLQVERMFREAANPNRQAFREVEPLTTWLAASLDAAELAAARAHLGG
jgi:hypothetical protein